MSTTFYSKKFNWETSVSVKHAVKLVEAGTEGIAFRLSLDSKDDWAILSGCLKASTSCKALDFKGCGIKQDGAFSLAQILSDENLIQYLYMYDNQIGDNGTRVIAECLQSSAAASLTYISLSKNNIGDIGARYIGEFLENNNSLLFLGLGSNKIGDEGAKYIARGLEYDQVLIELVLSYNEFKVEGDRALAAALRINDTLRFLSLHQDKITREGANALMETLKVNNTIEYVGLGIHSREVGKGTRRKLRSVGRQLERNQKFQEQSTESHKLAFADALQNNAKGPWNRSKLMVVGKGRSGKTATIRSLQSLAFDPNLRSTVGAAVTSTQTRANSVEHGWVKYDDSKIDYTTGLAARISISRVQQQQDEAMRQSNRRRSTSRLGHIMHIMGDKRKSPRSLTRTRNSAEQATKQRNGSFDRSNQNDNRSSQSRLSRSRMSLDRARVNEQRISQPRSSRRRNSSFDRSRMSDQRMSLQRGRRSSSLDRARMQEQRQSPLPGSPQPPVNTSRSSDSRQPRLSDVRSSVQRVARGRKVSLDKNRVSDQRKRPLSADSARKRAASLDRRSRSRSVDVGSEDEVRDSRKRLSSIRSSTSRAMVEFLGEMNSVGRNSASRNSANRNSANRNSTNRNSANRNSANRNSANRNSADRGADQEGGRVTSRPRSSIRRSSKRRSNKHIEPVSAEDTTEREKLPPVLDKEQINKRLDDLTFINAREEYDPINFSIWDYGGQSVFYTLHHLFLTNFGIYLVVFNMDEFVKNGEAWETLKFWLYTIKLHAPDAPILVVGTFLDKLKGKRDLLNINEGIKELISRFPVVVENDIDQLCFFPVSNKYGGGDGIQNIREIVEIVARNQAYINRDVSLRWVRCLDIMLENGKEKKYISLDHAKEISKSLGIVSADELEQMLSFFHDLGVIVHLTSTENLKTVVTTEPQWLVDSLGKVIRDPALHPYDEVELEKLGLQHDVANLFDLGLASTDLLEYLWDKTNVEFLIDLMKQSMLLSDWRFGVKDKEYLVPSMIVQEHDFANTLAEGYKCQFDFSRGILPGGIFERLVCLFVGESVSNPGCRKPELYKSFARVYVGPVDYFELTKQDEEIMVQTKDPELAEKVLTMMLANIRRLKTEVMGKDLDFKVRVGEMDKKVMSLEYARQNKCSPWFSRARPAVSVNLNAFMGELGA